MSSAAVAPDPACWRYVYGRWQGRLSRRSFWTYGVGVVLGLGFLAHALLAIACIKPSTADALVNALMLLLSGPVSAKRWQDRDRSGWWALLLLVPVVGALWVLLDNGIVRGTPGPNRFGVPERKPTAWLQEKRRASTPAAGGERHHQA